MPSPSIAARAARCPPTRAERASRSRAALPLLLLACAGCDIDDRTFENGQLTLSSRRDLGADAGAPPTVGDAAAGDAVAAVDGGARSEAGAGSAAERPIRAVGDASLTALLGGASGREERARCVEGVLVGLDYGFNDADDEPFPSRMTIVAPVCAAPVVSADSLDLSEPAAVAWREVGGDGSERARPLPTHRLRCPEGYAVVGLRGSLDEVQPSPRTFAVRELELDCAPLLVNPARVDIARGVVATVAAEPFSPAPGSIPIEVACEPGTTAATGAVVRWGSWLDGVGLGCSRLTWPFVAGRGCALDDDCQSGVCAPWATCAP